MNYVLMLFICAVGSNDCRLMRQIPFNAAVLMPTTCAVEAMGVLPELMAAHPNRRIRFECARTDEAKL